MSVANKKFTSSKNLNYPIIDILERIKQPLVIIDDECCIRYANPAYYNFFKTFREVTETLSIDEVSNRDWQVTNLSANLKHAFASGGILERFEVSQKFSQLGNKKILLDMHPIPGSNRQLYMLSFDDITIDDSETFLQSIVDTVQNLVYVYDFDRNKTVFINKKSEQTLGYTAEEIQQAQTDIFTQKIHPDDLDRIRQHRQVLKQLQDGQNAVVEYRIRNSKGNWLSFKSQDTVFKRAANGNPLQYVGMAIDITEIVDANKILATKNAALENSNNELYSFSSIASHDLKEPLRKIQMFGNFVMDNDEKNVSENSKRYLSKMILAAGRMQTLIDDLISYSRSDFDKNKFIQSDLNHVLDEVTDELKDAIEDSQTTIEISRLGLAFILPSQFRQLFINLISNSIKYCKTDCLPTIRIFSREAPSEEIEILNGAANQPFIKISIEDNGIGFDNVYKTKIFEPFQRLHTRSDYSGTGIGLSICKKIAENHKGFITAESEPGNGTRFDIYIPVNY